MTDVNELVTRLYAIEDWLRECCTARHNDDMADDVRAAADLLDDAIDAFPPAEPATPEQQAEVNRILDALRAKLSGRR